MRVDSQKKKKNKLVAKVNSPQAELNHVSDSYISQLENVTQVNEDMKVLLLGVSKDKEVLRKN